jgi:hypothetical protein
MPRVLARTAAVTRRESPGRKGNSTPDSIKMMSAIPTRTQGPKAWRMAVASGSKLAQNVEGSIFVTEEIIMRKGC